MGDWQPHQYPRGRGQILLRETTDVTELVINNPGARHAMSVGMMADLVDAVRVLQEKPPLALLVRGGDDSAFCAGGDLRDVRSHLMNSQAAKGMPVVMGETLDALAALPSVPTNRRLSAQVPARLPLKPSRDNSGRRTVRAPKDRR